MCGKLSASPRCICIPISLQYEVNGKARYEPVPEMEKRVRSMAMERLRMEKVGVSRVTPVAERTFRFWSHL